jgi:2-phospho-L-lactate guanylyltransferase (CobY/MobA/RfbA family)
MPTFVIPYRLDGKSRLGDREVARAMLDDVRAACARLGAVVVCDAPGGQGQAVAACLHGLSGTVAIVNADVPCVTAADLEALLAAAPALVAARDDTTNALSLLDPSIFRPLYGPGSARRFAEMLGAAPLELPGLRDDVDTWEDLVRVGGRAGPHTLSVLQARAA